jgi:hypothetical protein
MKNLKDRMVDLDVVSFCIDVTHIILSEVKYSEIH